MTSLWRPLLLSWLLLFALQAALGAALVRDVPVPEGSPLWLLAANFVTVATLLVLARAQLRGRGRALTLFAVWGGLQANNLVEAYFFGLEIPGEMLGRMLAHQLLVAVGLCLAIDRWADSRGEGPRAAPPAGAGWLWRVVASDALYVVLYFAAGMAVFPFVAGFYAERTLPDPSHVLAMQVFRGLVFTGIALLLARRLGGSRNRVALVTGLALSALGGVAPLLSPNPFMPTAVRLAHLVEVGLSNFAFGWLAVRLLRPAAGAATAGAALPERARLG